MVHWQGYTTITWIRAVLLLVFRCAQWTGVRMASQIAEYLPIAGAILLPNLGGFLGSFSTRAGQPWYDKLKKPWFQPPKWLFGPVWTSIYTCMGVSSYLIWREGGFQEQALPLALFGTQLALNWAWSPLFFSAHKMGLVSLFISHLKMWFNNSCLLSSGTGRHHWVMGKHCCNHCCLLPCQ